MSDGTVRQFARRLNDYVSEKGVDQFSIIFHGGEPLLYGGERLQAAMRILRETVSPRCNLDFSLQTNGVLLSSSLLDTLAESGIGISLSLDGPRHANDRHRLDHRGASTFEATLAALDLLRTRAPKSFSGVIAVIDAHVPPADLLEFFARFDLPRIDLLLPDATHVAPPAGRERDPSLYIRWLTEAFSLWFDKYPALPIRWFDAIVGACVGLPSPTDIMGFGSVTLLVIDTDGTYKDHDVFKITGSRMVAPLGSVEDAAIADIGEHPAILRHAALLTPDGIAAECRTCPVVAACGGGCVMHRAHSERGFDAPTVYCGETFGLLTTAARSIRSSLNNGSGSRPQCDLRGTGRELIDQCEKWNRETRARACAKVGASSELRNDFVPAAIILGDSKCSRDVEPSAEPVAPLRFATKWLGDIRVHVADERLAIPFKDSIRVLPPESPEVRHFVACLDQMTDCLSRCDETVPLALKALITDVMLVESTMADEGGIFSFSDDSAPDVVYIAPYAAGKPIAPDDLAESVYHEFLHHILYHYELEHQLLYDKVQPQFPAPWRSGMRPANGFLHGTFVFTWLAHYWDQLSATRPDSPESSKATANAKRAGAQATYGVKALTHFALTTPHGLALIDSLAGQLGVADRTMPAPGLLS